MRAKEFITEDINPGELHDESTGRRAPPGVKDRRGQRIGRVTQYYADVSPGAQVFDGMDKYYDLYRMSMIMAGDPNTDVDIDPASWIANAPFVSGYTDADDAKIAHAAKKLKGVRREIAPNGSTEPGIVNKVSPIRAFRGYPR